MILGVYWQAMRQLRARPFRRLAGLGLALTLALLFAVYALFLSLTGDPVEIPFLGPIERLRDVFAVPSLVFLAIASIILMLPVTAVFAGLFLPDVAATVEAQSYVFLPPAPSPRPPGLLIATANLLGLMLVANLGVLLFVLPATGPGFVLVFWALNGALLGRACFLFTALRRLPRAQALAMRRRNFLPIWAAGTVMALLATLPGVNLLAPLVGTAAFAHLYHRLAASAR